MFLAAVMYMPLAQADIYKCVGEEGRVTLSNIPAKRCKKLFSTPPSSKSSKSGKSAAPKSRSVSTPAGFPKVDEATQRTRDRERRRILDDEMAREERGLEEARKILAELGDAPRDERDRQRLQSAKNTVVRHTRNIEALREEIRNMR